MWYILVSCARSNTSFNLFLSDYFYVVKNTLKCPIVLCLGLLSCSHYSVTINGNISAFSVHTYQEPFVKVLAQLTPFRNKIAKNCIKIGWKIKKLKFWPLSVISETFRDGGNPSKYGRTLSVQKKKSICIPNKQNIEILVPFRYKISNPWRWSFCQKISPFMSKW